MRTGTRCTILVELPVALSGGSSENTEPEVGATLTTVPSMLRPESASTERRRLLPRLSRSSQENETGQDYPGPPPKRK
jgi:hypothetical protein